MKYLAIAAALAIPGAAFAVGSDDTEPPTPTETTTQCTDGQVWDDESEACVDPEPEESRLSPDTLYRAVRELAYGERYDDALRVIAAMPQDDRALTYLGFIHRKTGRIEQGAAFYAQALALNPDNMLARSYRGQGYVAEGEVDKAAADLAAIPDQTTWAWRALNQAIQTGASSDY
jgi:tetratricopeptide (TPR) repeat protein